MKKILKPWGYEILFAITKDYAGKVLFIKKGEELSYQYHRKKEETIYLFKGSIRIVFQSAGMKKTLRLSAGSGFHIPPMMKHRIAAIIDSYIFEVSTPHLDDVVRLEDRYGRT
ncbi:MAG: cupin [Acidobacteriota bacterium]